MLAKAERQRQAVGLGDPPAEPGPQGARLAAPGRAGPDLEAEVPHRRRQRADRGRARRRATGSSCSSSPPSGSARTSSTSRTSTSSAASGSCSRTPPGGSARATGSASSASTAPARPRCCRCSPGALAPRAGKVKHGRTVALQHLTQQLDDLDPEARVLPTVESIRRVTKTADGEITASSMLERFGFTGDRLTARIGDLSGGERRRFQLLLLLLDRAQRAAPRRAHQRPRHRDPQRARGLPRRLARHAGRGLPRPLLPRAGHRLDLGAARRRPDLDAAARGRRVPRAPSRQFRPSRTRRARSARSPPTAAAPEPSTPAPRRRRRPAAPRSGPPARPWPGSTSSWRGSPPARPSSTPRSLEHAQDYERLAELSAELQRARGREGRARAGVAGGRRAPGVGARDRATASGERRRSGCAAGAASRVRSAAGEVGEQRPLGLEQRLERAVDGGSCPRRSAAR